MKFGKIARAIMFVCNSLAIIWLLLCMYAGYFDTSIHYSIISLFSFTLPFAILANLFFALFWIIATKKLKWVGFLSLITLMFSWSISRSVFGLHPFATSSAKNNTEINTLKIMTYNVHLFDLGEWTKNQAVQRKILEMIQDESPDVLCMQEFVVYHEDEKLPFTALIADLGYPYFQFNKTNTYRKNFITSNATPNEKMSVGNAIFSKYPIENVEEFDLTNNYKLIATDIVVNDNYRFSLLTTHLQSVRFGNREMEYIDKLKAEKNLEVADKSSTKNILKKLALASSRRASQANKIISIKKQMKYPIIICGDFNDVPGSYVYLTIKKGLEDPFSLKGYGLSRTYNKIIPTLRIDHIFYDNKYWNAESYNIIKENLSDHYPVIAEFSLKKSENQTAD